jgi:hypothetical protein
MSADQKVRPGAWRAAAPLGFINSANAVNTGRASRGKMTPPELQWQSAF